MALTEVPFLPAADGSRIARLDGLVAGVYHLTVRRAAARADPGAVHDLIAVAAVE